MDPPLEDVQFLAGSVNRVGVLAALVDGRATRRDLQEEVGASRSTVARILDGAHKRGWVASEGSEYWLTPLGEAMVTDFRSYLETVEGYHHLGDMVNHLPPPLFSLDARHLRDAEIVEVKDSNPAAPFTKAYERFREATDYRGLNNTSLPEAAKILHDRVEQGQLDVAQVLEKGFIETLRGEPERAAMWEFLADRVWLYEGVVPINMHLVDGTVLVWLGESRQDAHGLLISENSAVQSWAESLYEEYRTEAEPFDEI